jgi:hypothetical protein
LHGRIELLIQLDLKITETFCKDSPTVKTTDTVSRDYREGRAYLPDGAI